MAWARRNLRAPRYACRVQPGRLSTTQIYTKVSIRKLQEVHALTHPGASLADRRKYASSGITQMAPSAQCRTAWQAYGDGHNHGAGDPGHKPLTTQLYFQK